MLLLKIVIILFSTTSIDAMSAYVNSCKDLDWKVFGVKPKVEKRCEGMFKILKNTEATNIFYSPLRTEILSIDDCLKECLKIPLCGYAVHYQDSACKLLQFWYINLKCISHNNTNVYKWFCNEDVEDNIPKTIQPSKERFKCTGEYHLHKHKVNMTVTNHNMFHTMDYQICLEECNKFVDCTKVWYSYVDYMCLLNVYRYINNRPFHRINMLQFDWICLKNDAEKVQKLPAELHMESRNIYCHKLINSKDLYIADNICNGALPEASKFKVCKPKIRTINKFEIFDNCQVNQSFWLIPYHTKASRLINGNLFTKFFKIYTGLTVYWLALRREVETTFKPDNFVNCRIFDGYLNYTRYNDTRITTGDFKYYNRTEWFAAPPLKPNQTTPVRETLNCFIMSVSDIFSCTTLDSCSYLLRVFQKNIHAYHYNDIQYNFIIDESGNIYEGYGWKKMTVHKFTCRPIMILILGSTQIKYPTIEALTSMKYLIYIAQKYKYVTTNFQILSKDTDNQNFTNILRLYDRYQGFQPKHCKMDTFKMIFWFLCLLCGFIMFMIIFIKLIFMKSSNCSNCEMIFYSDTNEYQLENIICDSNGLNFKQSSVDLIKFDSSIQDIMIIEKQEFFSFDLRFELFRKLRYLWLFNQLDMNSSRYYREISINTFLNNNLHYKRSLDTKSTQLYINLLSFHTNGRLIKRFILCTTTESKLRKLVFDIKQKSCICNSFIIDSFNRNYDKIQTVDNEISLQSFKFI